MTPTDEMVLTMSVATLNSYDNSTLAVELARVISILKQQPADLHSKIHADVESLLERCHNALPDEREDALEAYQRVLAKLGAGVCECGRKEILALPHGGHAVGCPKAIPF
jgi:hypothetical protein